MLLARFVRIVYVRIRTRVHDHELEVAPTHCASLR